MGMSPTSDNPEDFKEWLLQTSEEWEPEVKNMITLIRIYLLPKEVGNHLSGVEVVPLDGEKGFDVRGTSYSSSSNGHAEQHFPQMAESHQQQATSTMYMRTSAQSDASSNE